MRNSSQGLRFAATGFAFAMILAGGTAQSFPQTSNDKLAGVRAELSILLDYLNLGGKVDERELGQLVELKLKALSAETTVKERHALYGEVFLRLYRLQGNDPPDVEVAAQLARLAQTAAEFPVTATREASGWSTSTTPKGQLGHIEKIGDGPIPVILIPNQEGWSVYKAFMEQHKKRFTMYAVTLPGYGGTAPPPRPMFMDFTSLSWWRNAQQAIINLIDAQKIDKPVVVGVMYGAYLAGRIALDQPDKVRAAVMVNGLVYANDPMPMAERQKQARKGMAAFPGAELIPWSRRPPADAVRKAIEGNPQALDRIKNWARDPEVAKLLVIDATTNNHPAAARYGIELSTTDLTEDLKKLSVPLLVMPALSDKDSPYQGKIALTQFEEIKAKNPSIPMTIRPLEDVRQYVLFEAATKLGLEIEAFVSHRKQTRQ